MSALEAQGQRGMYAAAWVLGAGAVAALHVGKLSAAIPVLGVELGLTLVQAGFLLSLVQLAGLTLGMVSGLAADVVGLRRSMLLGLLLLGLASLCGGWADDVNVLMVFRALEGLGFLLTVMPAPALIRRMVPDEKLSLMLGFWGAYMPLGTALALLTGPLVIAQTSWRAWWWGLAALALWMAFMLRRVVPRGPVPVHGKSARKLAAVAGKERKWTERLRLTLTSQGPWLVALTFAMYSAQWLAIIGFLPAIYIQGGFSIGSTAVLTAMVAAVNMAGNMASGRLLQKGVMPARLLYLGFAVMGLASAVAFGKLPIPDESGLVASLRFLAVVCFSAVGGVIPGTLFSLALRHAPSDDTMTTTVGWMQQWSAIGQFAGPPLVGWFAVRAGGWQWTWVVTGSFALSGMALAWLLAGRRWR